MSVSSNLQSKPSWLDTFPDEDVAFGFDEGGMWFAGNASNAPYPVRTNYDIDGDTTVVVIYTFVHAAIGGEEGVACPDQGICFFKSDVEPYWSWGDDASRIAVQYDCGTPGINGQNENEMSSPYELTIGDTYTARVTYDPVAETITHELFEGSSVSGLPVNTIVLENERLPAGAYRIGFHADFDLGLPDKAYFTQLEISEGPEEIITRVFRVTHLPHRRRRAENPFNGAPTDLQPGELVYGELENTLYTAKNDGTIATVGGNRAKELAYDSTIATNAAEATVFDILLTGNATLAAPTNATNGQRCLWRIKRTNGQVLTLNNIFRIINGETIDNTDNATTFLDAIYDGDANRWDVILYSNKPATVPGQPTNVAAVTTGTADEIDLSWDAPTFTGNLALTDYIVQYSTNEGTTWTTVDESVSTATSLTVTELEGGTEHIFRVAAANSLDIGPYAESDPVTPLEALVPAAPTSVTGVAGDAQVALSWTAPTFTGNVALTDYVVQYSDDDGETWTTFSDATSTATSATVTGLTNDTAYVFRVAAVNSVGTGDYSATSAEFTPAIAPLPALLLHFDGANGSTTFTDNSQNALTVTVNGGAVISTAQSKFGGSSGYFDGNGDYLSVAPSAALNFSADFTIEMWIRVSTLNYQFILGGSDNSSGKLMLAINPSGPEAGQIWMGRGGVGWPLQFSGHSLTTDSWAHIAITRAGDQNRCFVNGVQIGAAITDTTSWESHPGGLLIGSQAEGPHLSGYMDELRIVNDTAAYTANFTPPVTPFADPVPFPSLLLHFDGTNGDTVLYDSSTYNFSLTTVGNAQLSSTEKKFGATALYLDGTGAAVTADASIMNFGANNFTVECWVYLLAAQYHGIVGSGANSGCVIGIAEDGSVVCDYKGAGTGVSSAAGAVSVNNWQHLAVTRQGSTVKIFVNGVTVATGTMSAPFAAATIASIGSFPGPVWLFNGYIDELRISNGRAAYTANFTPPTAPFDDPSIPTSLLLHFDGTNGSTSFTDSSSNELSVTPSGDAQISTAHSKFGGASVYFDGNGDYLTVANENGAFNFGINDFTIEYWFKTDGQGGDGVNGGPELLQYGNTVGDFSAQNAAGYRTVISQSGVRFWRGTEPGGALFTNTNYCDNAWHHVAFVRRNNVVSCFVDGIKLTTTFDWSPAYSIVPNKPIFIGGQMYDPVYWNGYVDELRIVKGLALYTANFTPPTAPYNS